MTDARFEEILAALVGAPLWSRRKYLRRAGYPRFLYKYRALDPQDETSLYRMRDVLIDSKLWLSSPIDFNDPFDSSAQLIVDGSPLKRRTRIAQLVREKSNLQTRELRRRKKRELAGLSSEEIEERWSKAFEKASREMGVHSFAGDARSILMWSHYGTNHDGLCLQFDISKDPRTLILAVGIQYSETYPAMKWSQGTASQVSKALLTKHCGWGYEKERRIIRPNEAHTYLRFRAEALTGVIFGCRSSPSVRGAVTEILEERKRLRMSPVKAYQATRHAAHYRLVVKRAA